MLDENRFPRFIATMLLAWRYRKQLALAVAETPNETSIYTICPDDLQRIGVMALALDFDGVLANHGAPCPCRDAADWLHRMAEAFGEANLYILSNKPTDERKRWFMEHFPAIRFIASVRKKPFPDGLLRISEISGFSPSAIAMIDDRLLTGVLAALIAGAKPLWIRRPIISFSSRPAAEFTFFLIRKLESLVF